jgi:hypothetical protein
MIVESKTARSSTNQEVLAKAGKTGGGEIIHFGGFDSPQGGL